MTVLTVTSKGQVTLRKELLKHLGVAPGDKIDVELLPDGELSVRSAHRDGSINRFFGCLARDDEKPLSLEQIDALIAEGWAGRR